MRKDNPRWSVQMLRFNTHMLSTHAQHSLKLKQAHTDSPIFEMPNCLMYLNVIQNWEQGKSILTALQPAETERISWSSRQYKWLLKDGFLLLLDIFFRLSLFIFFLSNPYIVRNHIYMLAFGSQGKSRWHRARVCCRAKQEGIYCYSPIGGNAKGWFG